MTGEGERWGRMSTGHYYFELWYVYNPYDDSEM